MLRLLKLKAIVDGNHIYILVRGKPIVITAQSNPSKLVVTDGFHITKPVVVRHGRQRPKYFRVVCAIENEQLIIGTIITGVVYAMGYTSGIIFLKLLSTAPIIYFLFLYYINRKEFIKIEQV